MLLSALMCGGSVYAQKSIDSYSGKDDVEKGIYSLTSVMTKLSQVDAWTAQQAQYKKEIDDLNAQANTIIFYEEGEEPNPTETTLAQFMQDYKNKVNNTLLKYVHINEGDSRDNDVLLAIPEVAKNVTLAAGQEWKDLRPLDLRASKTLLGENVDEDGTESYTIYYDNNGKTVSKLQSLSAATLDMYRVVSAALNLTLPGVKTRTDTEEGEKWKEKKATADANYNEVTANIEETKTFKNLSITTDITVPEKDGENAIKSLGVWPEGYTIDGNNHRIINESKEPLFTTVNGDIKNWISLDQSIASTVNATKAHVTNCIVKYSGGYRIYNDLGTVSGFTTAQYGDAALENAIYSVRDTYGMNFSDNSVGVVTDANRLYQAQYANAAKTGASSFKMNIKKDENDGYLFVRQSGTLSANADLQNTVIYIDNTDVPSAVKAVKNVAMKDGDNYVCANAELTDKSKDFYAPIKFTADILSYARTVKTQYASVCLPFELDDVKLYNMGADAYTYAYVDDKTGKMKFSPVTSVAANTPCILAFADASEAGRSPFASVEDVEVASTPAKLSSDNKFYGNYKVGQTAADLIVGKAGKYVYGVQGDQFVKMVGNTKMNAFRGFVVLDDDLVTTDARPFTISLLDEDGNEEVTGIELVSTADNNTSDFKAVGGRNAIEITTGKACDVKVYTLNGALAKTAHVEAGTTTLPMNAGMYVVNKTKVIVK